jgi:membrane protein DedA with SNARE-associated domain
MTSYFAEFVNFVGTHPHYALTAVFLLALSEAIPVIGTVVPGSTLIIGISALATAVDVNPWLLLVAATGGAIAGRWFVVLAWTAIPPGDSPGLAAKSVSAVHWS